MSNNDIIGLGCGASMVTNEVEPQKYYVFKLTNGEIPIIPLSDGESDGENEHQSENENADENGNENHNEDENQDENENENEDGNENEIDAENRNNEMVSSSGIVSNNEASASDIESESDVEITGLSGPNKITCQNANAASCDKADKDSDETDDEIIITGLSGPNKSTENRNKALGKTSSDAGDTDSDIEIIGISGPKKARINSISEDIDNVLDNEEDYSQKRFMQIKQEASDHYSQENDFEIDEMIVNDENDSSDNNDDSYKKWQGKLSQDQDIVIKKVIASTENKKPKAAKLIDSMPVSMKRRKSIEKNVSSSKQRKISIDKRPKNDENHIDSTQMPCTSKSLFQTNKTDKTIPIEIDDIDSVEKSDAKNKQNIFVDPLDPFAPKIKKVEKPISFESALSISDARLKKPRRIAHQPKSAFPRSILRSTCENRMNVIKRKSVDFKYELEKIQYFEKGDHEDDEILVAPKIDHFQVSPLRIVQKTSTFEIDALINVINEITEWKPHWLQQKNNFPIVGSDCTPLLDEYSSFEIYEKYVQQRFNIQFIN